MAAMLLSRSTLNVLILPMGGGVGARDAGGPGGDVAACVAELIPYLARCTRVPAEDIAYAPSRAAFPSRVADQRALHVAWTLHAPGAGDAEADVGRLHASSALAGVLAVADGRGVRDVAALAAAASRAASALLARHGLPTTSFRRASDPFPAALVVLDADEAAMAAYAAAVAAAACAPPSALPACAVDFISLRGSGGEWGGGACVRASERACGRRVKRVSEASAASLLGVSKGK